MNTQKKEGAKIGDTFEYGGKKYKFEYADKKKNEEFMKNYEAKKKQEPPIKTYDKATNTLTYNKDVQVKGQGTPDVVQKLPVPSSKEIAGMESRSKAIKDASILAQKNKQNPGSAKGKMLTDFGI